MPSKKRPKAKRSTRTSPKNHADRGGVIAGDVKDHSAVVTGGIHLHFNGASEEDPAAKTAKALSPYFEYLVRTCDVVWLPSGKGMATGAMRLLHVYADLHTVESRHDRSEDDGARAGVGGSELKRVPVLESVVKHRLLALLGEPGGGKSTFLRYMSVGLAGNHLNSKSEEGRRFAQQPGVESLLGRVPFWIELRRLPSPPVQPREDEVLPWILEVHLAALADKWKALPGLDTAATQAALVDAWKSGVGLFLLDGLDEVTNPDRRERIKEEVWRLATAPGRERAANKNRFVLTCREKTWFGDWQIEDWTEAHGAQVRTVARFDERDRRRFLHNWFKERARLVPEAGAAGHVAADNRAFAARLLTMPQKLAAQLEDRRRDPNGRLVSLASIPLNLTMIAWLRSEPREQTEDLPLSRAAIYEQTVHAILWELDDRKALTDPEDRTLPQIIGLDPENRRRFVRNLARITFESLRADPGNPVPSFPSIYLETELARFWSEKWPKDHEHKAKWVLRTIQCRAGLMKDDGQSRYQFTHRSFAEYLVALHWASCARPTELAVEWLKASPGTVGTADEATRASQRERLWEPLRLAVGFLSVPEAERRDLVAPPEARNRETVQPLLYHLIRTAAPDWRDVWLAGELWLELGWTGTLPIVWQSLLEAIRNRLCDLIRASAPSPFERATAGAVLGHMGDPRRGVAPPWPPTSEQPFFDWVGPVGPAPDFEMGGDPHAFQSPNPAVRQPIRSPFLIARYPVTNAQFDWFEKSDYFLDRRLIGRNKSDSRFTVPNQPAVYVSWDDAMHFCAWLNAELRAGRISLASLGVGQVSDSSLRWLVALPTEAQWELAARGPTGRWLPWMETRTQPDGCQLQDQCNWGTFGIDGTSAVGLFPSGAAPTGALDMIGNVWEWTRSEWVNIPAENENEVEWSIGSNEARVLRGGSWGYGAHDYLRCATRVLSHPRDRDFDIGFRCVLVRELASGG